MSFLDQESHELQRDVPSAVYIRCCMCSHLR